jgi:hypothetical protein
MGDVNRFSSKKAAQAHYDSFGKPGVAEDQDDENEEKFTLVKSLKWPELVNKVNSAMKATGWKGRRQDDGSFMFSTRGQLDDEWYIVVIDNRGNNMFTYALGTVEEGEPHIGEQESLPMTEASVSELMMAVREGYGLNESGVAETVSASHTTANTSGAGAGMTAGYQRRDNQPVDEGWKDIVAGSAMALGALGASAQSMPNINAQQVELTNKYYKVLVQRAVEDGRTLDARTKNFLMAKAQDAAAQKIQKSTAQSPTTQAKPQFPSQGSEQRRAKDFEQFESQDYLSERRL